MFNSFRLIPIIAMILAFPSTGWSWTEEEMREQIEMKLKEHHPKADTEFWSSLGPLGALLLQEMYNQSESTYHRLRILDSLAHYSNPSNTRFLKSVVEAGKSTLIQSRALRALGQSQGLKEKKYFEKLSSSTGSNLRVEAMNILQRIQKNPRVTQQANSAEPLKPSLVKRFIRPH